ncbi:alpha/beta hydrolase [bacterium]|nr:alpha/beta hydrolase [bacterium]
MAKPSTLTWLNRGGRDVFAQIWTPDGDVSSARAAVVIVHGLGEHSGRFAAWAQRFVAHGIPVYALDTHGHGRTTGRRGHTESFGLIFDDIRHLLMKAAAAHPAARTHLYGHSMGGALALGFAALRAQDAAGARIASVIGTGTAVRPGFEPPAWKIKLANMLDSLVPGLALGNELDPAWLSSDPAVVAAYKADPLVHDRISVRWYNEWMRTIAAIKENPGQIQVPVLMMHGDADRATSPSAARDLAAMLNAKFQTWPGAFHEIHHEPCKDEVFAAILSWINSLS